MAYTPNNNPYAYGDPYMYDLVWIVEQLKQLDTNSATYAEDIAKLSAKLNAAIMDIMSNPDFINQIAQAISTNGNNVSSVFLQEVLPLPDYAAIPITGADITLYAKLISKYDGIVPKDSATLTKHDYNSNDTDESGLEYVWYELLPTGYNRSKTLTSGGITYSQIEYTYQVNITANDILVSAGVHGDERQAVETLYTLIKFICESDNPLAQFVRNNIHIVIAPCVNPWGYNNDSRDNYNGDDINRDFPSNGNASPYQTKGAQFLGWLIDQQSASANKKNGTVYIDCHDFTGGGTYASDNAMCFSNSFDFRRICGDVFAKVYNALDADYIGGIKGTRPLRIQALAAQPTASLYAYESGVFCTGIIENRLYLESIAAKYSVGSRFISWLMLSGIIAGCLPLLAGHIRPFDQPTTLNSFDISTDDTIFEAAAKVPRFGKVSFYAPSTWNTNNLGMSLPTYSGGTLAGSIVIIDKTISAGGAALIQVIRTDDYGNSSDMYYSFIDYDGNYSVNWYKFTTT